MLRNYVITALRTFQRQRGYSFINVAGLTLGLASCLLIFQYIAFEYSYDRFNEHFDRLYRVTETASRSGEAPATAGLVGFQAGLSLAAEVPEIVEFARVHPDYEDPVISNPERIERSFEERRAFYVDPSFLRMFSYPLVSGDTATALEEPGTLLLSESSARKYFDEQDPVGKTLEVTGWVTGSYRVSGVFRDVPANSHLQFDFLLPMRDLLEKGGYNQDQGWYWENFATYVLLRGDADLGEVNRKFTDVLLKYRGEQFAQTGTTASLGAQPLRDIHLNPDVTAGRFVPGNYRTVYFFAVIGLITLLIALVNYVNLATARSLKRAREVGIRKVVGARRKQLVAQFLFESAMTNLVAVLLALGAAYLLRPLVNDLAGTHLSNAIWGSPIFWTAFLSTLFAGTLLAGLYPAFVLSSFRPASVLKGTAGSTSSGGRLRKGLVVLQFTASIAILAGTVIVYSQLDYMRRLDLGIDLEQILVVPGPRVLAEGADDETSARLTLVQELRKHPSIRDVATSSSVPGRGFNWYSTGLRRETADPTTGVDGVFTAIDSNFARIYGLSLAAGRDFRGMTARPADDGPRLVIVNETAVRSAGFDTPADAVDQLLHMAGRSFRIVGVFRDFSWSSAHAPREAALFGYTEAGGYLSLKVSTENLPETIRTVEQVYASLFPGNPFDYHFVDEQFDEQYSNDRRFAALFTVFAALAIAIACLGLFGLASYTAQQRTKEIGVRKVLGASVAGLVALFSADFLKLVAVAVIVATPVAYVTMRSWLDDFAYRTEISGWIFPLTGLAALGITLLVVSYQAVTAALADPVKSLRSE